jgi:hypothetical protein
LCSECDKGRLDLLVGLYSDAGVGVDQQEKQRLHFEHQLWQLLPLVLLPCARALLSPSAQGPSLDGPAFQARQVIATSSDFLHMGLDLSRPLLAGDLGLPVGPKQGTWVQEMLGELLQLAGLIALLPPVLLEETAAATQGSIVSSSSSNSGTWTNKLQAQADMSAFVAGVLSAVVQASRGQDCARSRDGAGSPHGAAAAAAVAVPTVAERFVEVFTAVEAAQRVVLAAAQTGSGFVLHKTVLAAYREVRRHSLHGVFGDNGVWHMGRCGPVPHAQEQRQYYSALSTVLKLGCCAATAKSDSARQLAGCCCVIAGHAALLLLPTALLADQQPQTPAGAAAVMVANQLAAVDYLPSMVLFGRCCLLWAELLRLEGPQLLLLAAGQQQEGWDTVLHENSAALVCIPWPRQWIDGLPWDTLECLTGLLSKWVGGVESPLALDRLAAAGCAPRQLHQQLEALLSAQQGVQQGLLTEASLAALVRQLQVVGGLLTSIAVPHFCNNPACGNASGPTDVRLVSGRSCMCAGCLTARYCGRDCQRAAWKQHKPVCKALAAAAADVAAAAAGS